MMQKLLDSILETSSVSGLEGANARIGVYYEDLITGEKALSLRGTEDDIFESASVIKLWIMSEAFRQEKEGLISFEDKTEIREEDMVPEPGFPDYNGLRSRGLLGADMFPESGVLNFVRPGLVMSLLDLVNLMIIVSDNTATNILIDRLGKDAVNEHIRSLGYTGTVLRRKLFETVEGEDTENTVSLGETGDFLKRLYCGRLVSEDADRQMLRILQSQQNTYKIPFFIRKYPIAHKTGEDTGIENDVAIVMGEKPFVLCFASNAADEPQAVRLCQDIAQKVSEATLDPGKKLPAD